MSSAPSVLVGDELAFDRDLHRYIDLDGRACMSVTQALKIAGLVDFSMVPPDVLEHARNRGSLVHEACARIDIGESLDDVEIPAECFPYIDAYLLFCKEMKYVPDQDWIERPMIVDMFGHRVGMMPDSVGIINGTLTVIERKATSVAHPAWGLQTAGYTLGLQAAGLQIRQRAAVQLLRTGRYKLHPHEDQTDLQSFGDVYRTAALKLKYRLAELD